MAARGRNRQGGNQRRKALRLVRRVGLGDAIEPGKLRKQGINQDAACGRAGGQRKEFGVARGVLANRGMGNENAIGCDPGRHIHEGA